MKNNVLILIGLVILLGSAGTALAQHSGPYVGGFAGGNMLSFSRGNDSAGKFTFEFDPALQWGGVLGWDLVPGSRLGEGRLEVEYAHRSNQLNKVSFKDGSITASGKVIADSIMLNAYALSRDRRAWSPYAGLGFGAARIEASDFKVSGNPMASGTSTVFAYQAAVGVDYALTENFSLDLGYRFMGTIPPEFTEVNGLKLKMDYYSHSAMLGFRFGF